ncbi:uncharacterized protein LOC114194812 [Vigna unguiculata]|uniref:uncharacterized protein LOC114194812 n=1 Tax=Vigna unguiculata TaxID=3917 RepID=UPI001016B74E|nr:uncharacterized protein LOC114194812 [Vigna unguiculata]
MVNDGYGMNLACKLNEMVGVKVAWYWHELKSQIYGLREMDGYRTTEKEMKTVNYQEMVAPQFHNGSTGTYVFSAWTSDNFKQTGCYNLQCSGFVQISQDNFIGSQLHKISVYGGQMADITISITMDRYTKNWWLSVVGHDIGYYPAELFSNMASADRVGWGGRTVTPPGLPSPQMGSGIFPDGNFLHAAYFKFISFQNEDRKDVAPNKHMIDAFVDKFDCFNTTEKKEEISEVFSYLEDPVACVAIDDRNIQLSKVENEST